MFKIKLKRDDRGELSVGKIIGVVIVTLVGLLMLPLVTDAVDSAKSNVTGTASTLLDMIPIFYVLGIVLAAVVWVIAETRGFGGR